MRTSSRACRPSMRRPAMNVPPDAASSPRCARGASSSWRGIPHDPINQGAICARGQAGLQGLYNPDRLARADAAWGRRQAHENILGRCARAVGESSERCGREGRGSHRDDYGVAGADAAENHRGIPRRLQIEARGLLRGAHRRAGARGRADGLRPARPAAISHRSGRDADFLWRGFPRNLALADRTGPPVRGIPRT